MLQLQILFIYNNSRISNNAKIYGNVNICDNVKIAGDSKINGNVKLFGNAIITGKTKLTGDLCIGTDAFISNSRHVLYVTNIGPYRSNITFYLTLDKNIMVESYSKYDPITIERFENLIPGRHKGTVYYDEYIALLNFVKVHFSSVKDKELT